MPHKRALDYGLAAGTLPRGPRCLITDVPGVTVGHQTIDTDRYKTGVTVVMPCAENPFFHKLPAAAFVLNGFGKSLGLMQLQELGSLETPIALTNTLNVGLVHDALVGYMIDRCRRDGKDDLHSVNPIVCECCDGTLNDIQGRPVHREHVLAAIDAASEHFDEGDVGAGKGMICHGLKGGIGSASRVMTLDGRDYTLGVLVLTNHGSLSDLTIGGDHLGPALAEQLRQYRPDRGSCIVVAATDLPLDARQLGRVVRRAGVGLARLGSFIGQGSGEVFLGFSTANPFDPRLPGSLRSGTLCSDDALDLPFRAIAECTEEAVLNSLLAAHAVTGFQGREIACLTQVCRTFSPVWRDLSCTTN